MLEKDVLVDVGYLEDEYLFVVDNLVVVFVGKIVLMQVIVMDVIYSWIIFVFVVKQDVVSGCIVQFWFVVDIEGVYFG